MRLKVETECDRCGEEFGVRELREHRPHCVGRRAGSAPREMRIDLGNIPSREERLREIREGGELSACPFCHIPRSQRSDYVRCCKCGINWLDGEPLDKDPRLFREAQFKESVRQNGG